MYIVNKNSIDVAKIKKNNKKFNAFGGFFSNLAHILKQIRSFLPFLHPDSTL